MARWMATFLITFLGVPAQVLHAGIVCPESTTVSVGFDCSFTGSYQPGQPYDRLTIMPDGSGETLAAVGIHVDVRVHDCSGNPVVGLPASSIVLYSSALCICAGGNIADGPTDAEGRTTFSGTIRGGGCVESLLVFVDRTAVASIPVRTNSPDRGPVASPCSIDAGDDGFFARFGQRAGETGYTICYDYNEDGAIDLHDLIVYGAHLGAACP